MSVRHAVLLSLLTVSLSACGGSRLVRNAKPPALGQPLVQAADSRLAAQLDWVIVRNGPAAWAKNGDWDEYLIRVRNLGGSELRVTNVSVVDSLGTPLVPANDRRALVAGSKASVRRYKGSGLKVKAGLGGGTIVAAGLGVSFGAGGAVAAGGGGMLAGLAGAAMFTMMAPGFGVAGIVRAVHNSQVNDEIGRRRTALPLTAPAHGEQPLDLFFPLAPSPQRIQISYADERGEHVLAMDTGTALAGLHLGPAAAAGGASSAAAGHR